MIQPILHPVISKLLDAEFITINLSLSLENLRKLGAAKPLKVIWWYTSFEVNQQPSFRVCCNNNSCYSFVIIQPVGLPGLLTKTIFVLDVIEFNKSSKSISHPFSFNFSDISLILPFYNRTEDLMLGHTGPTNTTSSPELTIKSQTSLNPIMPPLTTL